MTISRVHIIYNPNSTGDGELNATELAKSLREVGKPVELVKTEYARHAEELARTIVNEDPEAMVISSSGDGGYNEVINGVLSSDNPAAVTGVLPSGNANDHYHFVHRGDIVERIMNDDIDSIDVLKVSLDTDVRYAHSYVGLGVTPQIGEVLTKHTLNVVTESLLVMKHLFGIHPVKLRNSKGTRRYDNVIFSNIGKMSKYVTVAEDAKADDGLMEITFKRQGSLLQLLLHFLRRIVKQADPALRCKEYEFTLLRKTSMQLDGEVIELGANQQIRVNCEKQHLRCIV